MPTDNPTPAGGPSPATAATGTGGDGGGGAGGARHLKLTLKASSLSQIKWWVDAAYGVHDDLRGHTGGMMSLGEGAMATKSSKHKLNGRSSTEAEIIGVDDMMGSILWTLRFLSAQGYKIEENVVFQDNQSAILMERNGRSSCSKRTKHIDARYFFVTDCIDKREISVEYCPTGDMLADFFTKPLQGGLFRKFRAKVLNLEDGCHKESDPDPKAPTGVCCATSNRSTTVSAVNVGSVPNAENGTGNDELISNQAYVVNK